MEKTIQGILFVDPWSIAHRFGWFVVGQQSPWQFHVSYDNSFVRLYAALLCFSLPNCWTFFFKNYFCGKIYHQAPTHDMICHLKKKKKRGEAYTGCGFHYQCFFLFAESPHIWEAGENLQLENNNLWLQEGIGLWWSILHFQVWRKPKCVPRNMRSFEMVSGFVINFCAMYSF